MQRLHASWQGNSKHAGLSAMFSDVLRWIPGTEERQALFFYGMFV